MITARKPPFIARYIDIVIIPVLYHHDPLETETFQIETKDPVSSPNLVISLLPASSCQLLDNQSKPRSLYSQWELNNSVGTVRS